MTTLALGHFLRFYNDVNGLVHAFQNFYINDNLTIDGVSYIFVPFGFSGMATNRQGELSPAVVVFPNQEISRGYLDEALRGAPLGPVGCDPVGRKPYIGEVDVNILDPENKTVTTKLLTYVGQATSGGWDDTALNLELSNILDAVTGDIPTRTLQRRLVGSLPTSANVRLR